MKNNYNSFQPDLCIREGTIVKMIKLENVYFKYKNEDSILENINLEINEGEIISIIGKNGTGKSTILNLIAGITKPSKGNIFIDEINTKNKKDFLKLRKKVGIVFQNPDNQILFPRVFDDIEFALKNLNLDNKEERIEKALNSVNMLDFKESNTYELSLGQKQRINIASVLAVKPQYIILDEPTTMIDSKEKENIYDCLRILKKEGFTIIFVTNNVNEILLSDKVLIIEDKQIKHIFKKEKILENVKLLEKCDIKLPDIIEIILKLKQNNIILNLKEWTIAEIVNEIVGVCKK